MQRPLCFILAILLFASCVKTKFNDKKDAGRSAATLPRSVTPGGVNVNTSTSGKIWGVNGHPDFQVQYFGNIDMQLDLLQEMGMSQYRVDVAVDTAGEIKGIDLTRFTELMTKCQQRGITVLPVVIRREYENASS
ncbi:MAG TPA: hypothetical protein VGM31_00605, partial [Puia sp.]